MRKTHGFTLIELLVVIAIIAILAAILFPVFAKARDKAKSATCQSNLKQLAVAIRMYCDDHDGFGPFNSCGSFVYTKLGAGGYGPSYGPTKWSSLYSCPTGGNYGMNKYRGAQCSNGGSVITNPWHIDAGVKHPEEVMLIADSRSPLSCPPMYFYDTQYDNLRTPRHPGVNNMAFCDGHVKGVSPGWLEDEINNADPATGRGNWYWWTY